jgi:hypothetical protein
MYQSFPFQGLPKSTKLGFLQCKYMYHLATWSRASEVDSRVARWHIFKPNPNFDNFFEGLAMKGVGIFDGLFVHFTTILLPILYILWLIGCICFPVLVYCTKKKSGNTGGHHLQEDCCIVIIWQ